MARLPRDNGPVVSVEHVSLFKAVRPQIDALLDEMRELSKKHPDGVVNKFKLRFINEKLEDANVFLSAAYRPLKGFEQFDVNDLPTNSDVVLILSQYMGTLNRWRSDHVYYDEVLGNVWRSNPVMKVE